MIAGTWMEIVSYQILGPDHKIHNIERKTTRWVYMVRGETDEKTNDFKARKVVAGNAGNTCHMTDASKRKEKQKCAIEKPKLDNARSLRGIYFIDPKDEEFKDIMKNARRELEIPMPAAMPCKTPKKTAVEKPAAVSENTRQKCLNC